MLLYFRIPRKKINFEYERLLSFCQSKTLFLDKKDYFWFASCWIFLFKESNLSNLVVSLGIKPYLIKYSPNAFVCTPSLFLVI